MLKLYFILKLLHFGDAAVDLFNHWVSLPCFMTMVKASESIDGLDQNRLKSNALAQNWQFISKKCTYIYLSNR